MSVMRATRVREVRRALRGVRGWSIGAAIALLSGAPLVVSTGSVAAQADLGPSISIAAWCVLVACALIGAASVASERRHGTWDLILAAPERPAGVLWAKGLAMIVIATVLSLGLPLQALAEAMAGSVDAAAALSGTIGLILVGAAGGALGLLAGVITRSGLAATAVAMLLVGLWTLTARSLQVMGDPWIAAAGFAMDPIRRAQAAIDGSVDLGGGLALACAWAGFVWIAARWADAARQPERAVAWRQRCLALVLGVASVVVCAVSLRGPGAQPSRLDLHGVFRQPAGEALAAAMRSATGPVRFTLMHPGGLGESALSAARQAVRRAAAVDPATTWEEIDVLDPQQSGSAARALEAIAASEREPSEAWRRAFQEGVAALERVCASAELAGPCQQAAARRVAGDLAANNLGALAAALRRAGAEGASWIQAFQTAAAASPERPIGDVEGAGRALAGELGVWAKLLRQGADAVGGPGSTRELRDAARRMGALSDACRTAQDQIDRLPPLRLTEVAAALRAPPVVVVTTAHGCAAVPAWRLVEGAREADEALAATLAAAQGAPRAAAVFVHAGQRSPLDATAGGGDFALVADALRGARMRVEAWNPAQAPRPSARDARARVWIVVPPIERRSVEPDAAEKALLEASQRLLRDGEPVFVLAAPSVAAAMGLQDPWADLLRTQGLQARTGAMVVELAARSESDRQLRTTMDRVARGEHPVSRALRGRVSWPRPMPLEVRSAGAWQAATVACIEPGSATWIEEDPRVISNGTDRVPDGRGLDAAQCVPVLALSMDEDRRVALAGGVAWALSSSAGVADARGALSHPGNRDLFVAVVRWLAGDASSAAGVQESGAGLARRALLVAWLPALVMLLAPWGLSALGRRA
jgi:hypothetical protein